MATSIEEGNLGSMIRSEKRPVLNTSVSENSDRAFEFAEARQAQQRTKSILHSGVKDVAAIFWRYLKEKPYSLLEADVKDIAKEIYGFLNQDVVGPKVILLDDEKLSAANAAARFLKRKRHVIKSDKQKSAIDKLKKIYKYLHNPFWQNSAMVGATRDYLDDHLRKMTPEILKRLYTRVRRLQTYFDGNVMDDRTLNADTTLKQMAMDFGYQQFAICEKHQQPLVRDDTDDVICNYTDCSTGKCPFEAGKAHGEEVDFLSGLRELLMKMRIIRIE